MVGFGQFMPVQARLKLFRLFEAKLSQVKPCLEKLVQVMTGYVMVE